jgi:hypothetical protein
MSLVSEPGEAEKIYAFDWSVKTTEIRITVLKAWLYPGFKFDFFKIVSDNQINGEWIHDLTFTAKKIRQFRALNLTKANTETYPEFFISYVATPENANSSLKKAHPSLSNNLTFVCYNDCKSYRVDSTGYITLDPIIRKTQIIRISLKGLEKPNVRIRNFRFNKTATHSTVPVKPQANLIVQPEKMNLASHTMGRR